jgi:membrane-associated phospholipid phosphatase
MTQTTSDKKKGTNWLKLLSAEFIIILVLLFVCITVFAYAVNMVFIKKATTFDENVFSFVGKHVTETRTRIMVFISFLGKHTFLIPANLVLLAYFLFMKNRRFSIRVAALALSSLSLMFLLKLSFKRIRPDIPLLEQVSGFSFPSGHALMSVGFYGLLIYITWHEIKNRTLRGIMVAFWFLLIVLIGFSRIYLRVHYASDVIAGFAVGFGWLLLSLWVIDKIEKKRFARKALAATPP